MSKESRCFRVDETLDYVKDSLEHLSDNDELFVSNCNDIKAAPNMKNPRFGWKRFPKLPVMSMLLKEIKR